MKWAQAEADRIHSELVRARGRCERCGTADGLQCAHIVRRRYGVIRHRLDNAWALCPACHLTVDTDAAEHRALITRTIGTAAWCELQATARRTDHRPDFEAALEGLREIRRAMTEAGEL